MSKLFLTQNGCHSNALTNDKARANLENIDFTHCNNVQKTTYNVYNTDINV